MLARLIVLALVASGAIASVAYIAMAFFDLIERAAMGAYR